MERNFRKIGKHAFQSHVPPLRHVLRALTHHGFLRIAVKIPCCFQWMVLFFFFFPEKVLYRNKHKINIKNQSSIFQSPPAPHTHTSKCVNPYEKSHYSNFKRNFSNNLFFSFLGNFHCSYRAINLICKPQFLSVRIHNLRTAKTKLWVCTKNNLSLTLQLNH